MLKNKINDIQSILVDKSLYPTERDAIKYVESLGKNAHFKIHPH
jgi:hypothetical protein